MTTSFTMPGSLKRRIEPLLVGNQTVSQFCFAATEEKVNRMEKRDEASRKKAFERDVELFLPVVREAVRRSIKEMRDRGEI